MASRIPLACSACWLYQRIKCVYSQTMKNGNLRGDASNSNAMRVLGKTILGLALVEVAHSLPANGRPGIVANYRKSRPSESNSALVQVTDSDADEIADTEDQKVETETSAKIETSKEIPGIISSWFESLPVKKKKSSDNKQAEEKALLQQVDRLREAEDFQSALDVLNTSQGDTVEHLWRRAHILYELSKRVSNRNEKKQLVFQSYELIERALEMDENNYYANVWISPILHAKAEIEGLVATANVAAVMKKHIEAIVRIRPQDPMGQFSYGMWYFAIAEISWLERVAANAIGNGLPTCTFADALERFQMAEKLEPEPTILTAWMLGKSYMELHDYENARFYLQRAANITPKKTAEVKAHKESIKLLQKLENHKNAS